MAAAGIFLCGDIRRQMDMYVLFFMFQVCCLHPAVCELTALSVIGKPAQLSTTHSAQFVAGKAVDGDLGTIAHNAVDDSHPWLRVDLEDEHCLGRITITIRDTGCGPEPCFFGTVIRAGLSSNYAENQPCGLPGTVDQSDPGDVSRFLCETPRMARYVTLDIDPSRPGVTDPTLKIAEVEVEEYAAAKCAIDDLAFEIQSEYFKRLYKGSLIGNANPLATKVAASLVRCAQYCLRHAGCSSFDFAADRGQCHLHNQTSKHIETTPSQDFSVYVVS